MHVMVHMWVPPCAGVLSMLHGIGDMAVERWRHLHMIVLSLDGTAWIMCGCAGHDVRAIPQVHKSNVQADMKACWCQCDAHAAVASVAMRMCVVVHGHAWHFMPMTRLHVTPITCSGARM